MNQQTDILPRYLTVKQTADYLGLKPKTIYNWLYDGECPIAYSTFGNKKLFAVADIEAHMQAHRIPPPSEIKRKAG